MNSEWMVATLALIGSVAVFGFAAWWGGRPPTIGRTRMIPWHIIQLVSVMGVILSLVHMLNLLGFITGRK